MVAAGTPGVLEQGLDEDGGLEQIDAHRDQALSRVPGRRERLLWLLRELDDPTLGVDPDDAEARGLRGRDRSGHDHGVCPGLVEKLEDPAIVGVVDVVSG